MNYSDFIQNKFTQYSHSGIEVNQSQLNQNLFDYQKYCVEFALKKGKFALFGGTGLGKTFMQLEWAYQIFKHTDRPVLIVAPLGVAKQTAYQECIKLGITVQYCKSDDDVICGINITNYERLHKFNCGQFAGVVLDESSILKGFNGKIKNQIIEYFANTQYKLACTATPSPNDYVELGNHAEFLNVCSYEVMLANYFVTDNIASKWRLRGHSQQFFWEWVGSWSLMFEYPEDLGFQSTYQLPELNQHFIKIDTHFPRDGELFTLKPSSFAEERKFKRLTTEVRVKRIADLINASDEQWIVWCETNQESNLLAKSINGSIEITGSSKSELKESAGFDFAQGKIKVLISKPKIYGFGMNWQNCHNVAFVSLTYSFESIYQAIRRCYRFGQSHTVNVYFAVTTTCEHIKESLHKKQIQFEEMKRQIIMNQNHNRQLDSVNLTANIQQCKNYTIYNDDCVQSLKNIESNSVDFSIFSPPFANLFVYSDSVYDMGNCVDEPEFLQHFAYMVNELYRVMKPGCIVAVHCQNLRTSKQRDGYIKRIDFRGDLIRLFETVGFHYYSEVTIWKSPVVEMYRTKHLSLLHKQIVKDSSMSAPGKADYLIILRKPGDRLNPVAGLLDVYYGLNPIPDTDANAKSISIWQQYASPVWMDIDETDVLPWQKAKESNDEKHLCPLQLTVIRRCIQLWSNPNDLVLSPFMGIGSEGYVSLDMGRRFVGIELKKSYFDIAHKNLQDISFNDNQLSLPISE